MCMLCFVIINSVLLNLLCVWIQASHLQIHERFKRMLIYHDRHRKGFKKKLIYHDTDTGKVLKKCLFIMTQTQERFKKNAYLS